MLIRFEPPDPDDCINVVYLGADCIESLRDALWPEGSCEIVMRSGAKHKVRGPAWEIYRRLTHLGYTPDSMSRRGA